MCLHCTNAGMSHCIPTWYSIKYSRIIAIRLTRPNIKVGGYNIYYKIFKRTKSWVHTLNTWLKSASNKYTKRLMPLKYFVFIRKILFNILGDITWIPRRCVPTIAVVYNRIAGVCSVCTRGKELLTLGIRHVYFTMLTISSCTKDR